MTYHFSFLTVAPSATAGFKQTPADFRVDEELGFEPDGEGDHVYLKIEKNELNTEDVVRRICELTQLKPLDVGYSGLKDRNAVTTQWFSVHLPGRQEPQWKQIEDKNVRCLFTSRHKRKLRRGTHRHNVFKIMLRDIDGDQAEIESRLQLAVKQGVPNYFGEQRFGNNYSNIGRAEKLFRGELKLKSRTKKGLYLSAIRSMLFNQVLSFRVADKSWNRALPGELLVLDGTNSFFQMGDDDAAIDQRIQSGDVHPSGPLWGKLKEGKINQDYEIFALEQGVMSANSLWCEGLENAGMKYERRALRLPVTALEWQFSGNDLELKFTLPTGSYATCVLRELVQLKQEK